MSRISNRRNLKDVPLPKTSRLRNGGGEAAQTIENSGVKSFWNLQQHANGTEAKPYTFADLSRPEPQPLPEEALVEEKPAGDAEPTPATYMDETEREAQEILREARCEAAAIREKAAEEGRAAGYKEGHLQGVKDAEEEQSRVLQQRVTEALGEVAEVVEQIQQEREALLEAHMDDLRELTLAIAEKVINVSLKSSGEIIERMIVAATEKSKTQSWAKIYISSYDAEIMMQGDVGIISAMQNITSNVKVEVMESAEAGECIIEFPDQIIDAGVKTQLDNIKEIMRAGDNG